MKLNEIGPMSDPLPAWNRALDSAKTYDEMQGVALAWNWIAPDAAEIIKRMGSNDLSIFRAGLEKERRGKFAGEEFAERFNAVLIPEMMFRVSMVANQFKVPWGLAYIRLREAGKIKETNGSVEWVKP